MTRLPPLLPLFLVNSGQTRLSNDCRITEVNSGPNMGLNPHGCTISAAINITDGLVIKKIVCPHAVSLRVNDTAAALLPLPAPSAYDTHTGTSTFVNASTSNFPSPRIARQVATECRRNSNLPATQLPLRICLLFSISMK